MVFPAAAGAGTAAKGLARNGLASSEAAETELRALEAEVRRAGELAVGVGAVLGVGATPTAVRTIISNSYQTFCDFCQWAWDSNSCRCKLVGAIVRHKVHQGGKRLGLLLQAIA